MYAFITWGHTIEQGTRRQELNKINKLACKMIAPVRRTTPRNALEIIYDLIPLDLFGRYEALAALTRQEKTLQQDWIGKNPRLMTYIGHRHYWHTRRLQTLGQVIISDREKGLIHEKNYTVNANSLETCLLYTSDAADE